MTEEEIQKLFGCPLYCNYTPDYCKLYHYVNWEGVPVSIQATLFSFTELRLDHMISYGQRFIDLTSAQKIDNLIKEANEAQCLTSNMEYIRECKRWFLQNNL